jgi:uncharacterized coiled-coil protein SlyX
MNIIDWTDFEKRLDALEKSIEKQNKEINEMRKSDIDFKIKMETSCIALNYVLNVKFN